MSQPINLSDEILSDARTTAAIAARSIEEQIELWAQLGRAIEPLLEGTRALALQQLGAVRPLSECLTSVNTAEGRQQLAAYLVSQPFPHYEAASDVPDLLIRIDEDGTRTPGRFVDRVFQAVE